MTDVRYRRSSGEVCYLSDGQPIIWNGHACEGANVGHGWDVLFCLWTRCKSGDVPANAAHRGRDVEITCPDCREILAAEEGRPIGSAAPEPEESSDGA